MTMMLRTFLLAVSIGLFIMTIFSVFIYEFETANDITPDPQMQEVYANYSSYLGLSSNESIGIQKGLEGSEFVSETGGEASIIKNIYSTIKLPFNQLKIVQSTTSKTFEIFHVSRTIYYALIGMVAIVLIAIFIGIITRSPT